MRSCTTDGAPGLRTGPSVRGSSRRRPAAETVDEPDWGIDQAWAKPRPDILHNNVGIEEFSELIDVTEESWDRVHAINLKGAMLTVRASWSFIWNRFYFVIINFGVTLQCSMKRLRFANALRVFPVFSLICLTLNDFCF